MAPSQRAAGSKPGPGQGKEKTRGSKRTIAMAKKQKENLLRRISQLEFQQSFSDEKAEHDATKAIASRLRLEHNDLVTRLDDAETALANAESRAWNSEKKIIKLQKSLSESKMGAQNNEAWMELMAEEYKQLEEANKMIVSRNIAREGELIQEIEHMEERAQNLEQALTIAYKDVEEYGVLFQRSAEDWAKLVNFLHKHKYEDGERIQELRRSVMEYSNAMDGVHDEVNKLIRAAEVRIACNRLSRDKAASPKSVQWDSQVSRPNSRSSSAENLGGFLPVLESSESDSNLSSSTEAMRMIIPGKKQNERSVRYMSLPHVECDTGGLISSSDTYIGNSEDRRESPDTLAPLAGDIQRRFTVLDVNETSRNSESSLSDSFNSDSDTKYDGYQDRAFEPFMQEWNGDSGISLAWGHPYNGRDQEKSWDQITDASSSPEGTNADSYTDDSWPNPSLLDPTSLSKSHLSNVSFEFWKFLKEPGRYIQDHTEIVRSSVKSLPVYFENWPGGYTPPLNTSRKRVRFAPASSKPNDDVDDEASVNAEQEDSIQEQDSKAVPSGGSTDCEFPLYNSIVNDELNQASILSVDQRQGTPIIVSVSGGIQTKDTQLLAHPDNLAASLRAPLIGPRTWPDPEGKLRSLSVGDLPRVLATGRVSAFERMPGSWPREAMTHTDINPETSSEIARAALQGFRAAMKNVLPVGMELLNRLSPSHPKCIVYPGLMVLWVWQACEQYVEWKRWESANERYMVQRLRNQYALPVGWVDAMGFSLAQWLAFDRSSFG